MTPRSDVDLHLHSTASDGALAPAALVAHVAGCGVRLMALTDHDTVAGVEEAAAAARRHGLGFVPGVELSAEWRGRSLHVLGLAIDPAAPALAAGLAAQRTRRAARAEAIAARLASAGLPGQELLAQVRRDAALPTRTHFARALVAAGLVPDLQAAFDRWLGRGRPGAVPSGWPPLAEIVSWIAGAGGLASLAHPLRYPLSNGARRELCREFRAAGGRALEVVTGGGSARDRELAVSLAVRTGLDGTVGSDFHDPAIPWNPPGRLAKLPGSVRPAWSGPPFPALAPAPEPA